MACRFIQKISYKYDYLGECHDEAKKEIIVEVDGNYYLAILIKHEYGQLPIFKVAEKMEETQFNRLFRIGDKQFGVKEGK